jgi:hypothetical protein
MIPQDIPYAWYTKKDPPPLRKKIKNAPPPGPKELLIHSTAHERMEYTGTEDRSLEGLRHYVGIYDPKTGTLEVVEARKMIIRGKAKARKEHEAVEEQTEKLVRHLNILFSHLARFSLLHRASWRRERNWARLLVPRRRRRPFKTWRSTP